MFTTSEWLIHSLLLSLLLASNQGKELYEYEIKEEPPLTVWLQITDLGLIHAGTFDEILDRCQFQWFFRQAEQLWKGI